MIPTLEQFKKDIMAIYPEGNIVEAYILLKHYYTNDTEFKTENIYNTILAKFRDHIDSWKRRNGEREEKYISKEDRLALKNIYDFLKAYMWRQEFKGLVQSKARDRYLFPNIPTDELKEQLQRFKARPFIMESGKDITSSG